MFIVTLLVTISIYDLYRHRIPNLLTLLLLIVALHSYSHPKSLIWIIGSFTCGGLFMYISRCGAGDLKLFLVIINCIVSRQNAAIYCIAICLIGSAMALITAIRNRSWVGDIAFAPALCGAVIAVNSFVSQ